MEAIGVLLDAMQGTVYANDVPLVEIHARRFEDKAKPRVVMSGVISMTSPRKPIERRQRPKKLSAKREQALKGQRVYSTIVKRGGRIKPKQRRASERKRIYGSADRIRWLKSEPCAVCGMMGPGFCEVAHVKNGGMGKKADARYTIPLCPPHSVWDGSATAAPIRKGCHRALHEMGAKSFEAKHGVDLLALADEYERKWQAHVAELSL
jgi:hypothetical protein